jgi:hypothetical protein
MHIKDFMECLRRGEVPPETPDQCNDHWDLREECIQYGMWAIVSLNWTKELADWLGCSRRVLEIMAGNGWLAKALQHHGVQIIATDSGEWDDFYTKTQPLIPVQKYEASDAIAQFGSQADVLLVSWSPMESDAICRAAEAWGSERPIVYIGEYGRCNASDEFFENFKIVEESIAPSFRSWYRCNDRVFVGYYLRVDDTV